jgi:hypothetical protein
MNNKKHMNQNKDIKDIVLEKIQTGKINMRPRFYFVLQVASLIVVAVVVLLISSLLFSFIIFSIITSGKLFLLGFGARGFWIFFILFPWPLLIIEVTLIILLEWLIKNFKFGYKSSLSRLVFAILLISIFVSVIIVITPLHSTLQNRAEQQNLPILGDYYRNIRRPPPDQEIFRGIVSDVGTSSFVLNQEDANGGVLNKKSLVIFPPGTPQEMVPMFGDTVFVAGQLMPDGTIQAYGFQAFLSTDFE